eukprot:s1579_g12.t1
MWQIYPQAFIFDLVAGSDTARNEAIFFVLTEFVYVPLRTGRVCRSDKRNLLAAGLSSDETHLSSQFTGTRSNPIVGAPLENLQGDLLEPDDTDPASIRLVPPGRLIHLARYSGARRAWWVQRSHPVLHRIQVHHGIGQDHSGDSYREGLQEALLAANGILPKPWAPVDQAATCACCSTDFVWSTVLRSEPHRMAARCRCHSCGDVVCDGCSQRKMPLPHVGILREEPDVLRLTGPARRQPWRKTLELLPFLRHRLLRHDIVFLGAVASSAADARVAWRQTLALVTAGRRQELASSVAQNVALGVAGTWQKGHHMLSGFQGLTLRRDAVSFSAAWLRTVWAPGKAERVCCVHFFRALLILLDRDKVEDEAADADCGDGFCDCHDLDHLQCPGLHLIQRSGAGKDEEVKVDRAETADLMSDSQGSWLVLAPFDQGDILMEQQTERIFFGQPEKSLVTVTDTDHIDLLKR